MNQQLITLLRDEYAVELLRHNLPRAFEVADAESRRIQKRRGGKTYEAVGQEVGVVREKILTAYLRHTLGDFNIDLPTTNSAMQDVMVFGNPLEIKTVTGGGSVKAKWTADTESAQRDISQFHFSADLLLVRIWWETEKDSLFYIPHEVLNGVAGDRPPATYLSVSSGTNNRGINIAAEFMQAVENHQDTVRIAINWQRLGMKIDPMARWLAYWTDQRGRDPLFG